jgi:Ca2+-transporting ATPase
MTEIPSLTRLEAERILKEVGKNELPQDQQGKFLHAILEVLREPMLLMLFLCGGVYLFIGQIHESLLLLTSAVFAAAITIAQQFKSEKALAQLKNLASPRASVIRDGLETRISGTDVVPKDLIVIREGDRIPADAIIVKSFHLQVDESLLTGESLPVHKQLKDPLYSGTMVVSGHGMAQVTFTGTHTEFGKIGRSIQSIEEIQMTSFQKQSRKFVKVLGGAAIGFCIFVALAYGWQMGNWPQAILAGLATAMSMLPEEMPIVMTLFMVLGAWRMSKHSVLTRRMSAIENLGTTTVLCVDKTGTLTENKMVLKTLWQEEANEQFLLKTAFAANHSTPFDPMEKAIETSFLSRATQEVQSYFKDKHRAKEFTISKSLPSVTCAWIDKDQKFWIATKGAPETIVSLCKLKPEQAELILKKVKELAAKGQRILGIAQCNFQGNLPSHQSEFPLEFVGLVGFEDPIRPEVPAAMANCYDAGVRVIMMTGDHPGTAQAVGEAIGIQNPNVHLTGHDVEKLSDSELKEKVKVTHVFARLKPEHKLRLVHALQAQDEVVAMTGDGINDAPALKAADIGIAMGSRGTDVAREASDLVLLDDHFASIVKAIRMGRRIFENVKNAIAYIMAIHVPIAGMAIIPVLMKWPLVLLPPQIVLLEFIIDPACTFVFEAEQEDEGIMKRKPRDRTKSFFGKDQFLWSITQGLIVLALVLIVYVWTMKESVSTHGRSLAFTTLIFGNLGLIFVNRSQTGGFRLLLSRENRIFQIIVLCVVIALGAISLNSTLKDFFTFGHLELMDLAVSFGVSVIVVLLVQGVKKLGIFRLKNGF